MSFSCTSVWDRNHYASEADSFCSADFSYARGLLFNGDLYTTLRLSETSLGLLFVVWKLTAFEMKILVASMFFLTDALLLLAVYHSLSPTQSDA